ncbi:MAG: ferritin-like domain-containing protein [Labilithrix sp.]|nr:ferritin-like domain-containing protein [Labilithrix sp.]
MLLDRETLPYDMFDVAYSDKEARRARRMESIYHVGQDRIWDGRDVLKELIERHGKPQLAARERHALARIFSVIMWGELAAWKISAQLTDAIVPLPGKLAASSQVHDEARHFYVMHDYLEALGERPPPLDRWSRRVLSLTLGTKSLAKKLLGMQLTIETIALTIFQRVRELEVEPVLTDLLPYYERDEARHVGLGIQMLPELIAKMSFAERLDLAAFHLDLYGSAVMSLKSLEPALLSVGVDPRSLLAIGFRKQSDIDAMLREEFPSWPEDPPEQRAFAGFCELLFPAAGPHAKVPLGERVRAAVDVARRKRPGVLEIEAEKRASRKTDALHRVAEAS